MRPYPLSRLLASVQTQTIVPDEILIIDGSTNDETSQMLETQFQVKISETRIQDFSITYHKVPPNHRGLTKQRNYGIERVGSNIDIVAFLDDDTVLDSNYFKNLGEAFIGLPDAAGIGGLATNENRWQPKTMMQYNSQTHYVFQNYVVAESSRNVLRNKLGLASNELPGVMPLFGHGRTFSYPLTGKNYPVDLLVGMSMAFRKKVVDELRFSTFFEGYGLYEDADFSLRALHYGQNYLATSVQLEHHHDSAGRPNKFSYGKMVVRNGWYVWRVKHPETSFKNTSKWYLITILLTAIRFLNIFTSRERKEAFTESMGRLAGLTSLIFKKPGA